MNTFDFSKEPPRAHADAVRKSFSVWHFFDPSKPWLLVPTGSFGGYFNWVPERLRVGPWSPVAIAYLTALLYLTALSGCYFYTRQEQIFATDFAANNALEYPDAWTLQWFYHLVGCLWMIYIIYLIICESPLGYRAWSTYTVQAWTLLTLRHGLCALIPWYPALVPVVEMLRFPCAATHTTTCLIWNFVLVPYILFIGLRHDEEKQKNFINFSTSFRVTNLHVGNIFLCILNVWWASPARQLDYADFYVSVVSLIIYMLFYLCILDRIGVHLYPVFSPRVGSMVAACWTGSILLYLTTFFAWKRLLSPDVTVSV